VATSLCAVPLADVVETLRPLAIAPLATAPPFVNGISIIRGGPVPVVDVGLLISGRRSSPARFVTIKLGDRIAALAVDAVVGVREIETDALRGLPPLLRNASPEVVAGVGALDAQLLLVLDGAHSVPEDVFQSLDASQAS
jgi:purine-binding chemotaxis protein CheW